MRDRQTDLKVGFKATNKEQDGCFKYVHEVTEMTEIVKKTQ